VDRPRLTVSPQPATPQRDGAYYQNVELALRNGELVVADPTGRAHVFTLAPEGSGRPGAADALAWVTVPARRGVSARLLVLDGRGSVLADIASDGWDVDELRRFGDLAGLPLVEENYADELTARAAYPLPPGALRISSASTGQVLLKFAPVLLPVLILIVAAIIASR
jgi:hypothetical protein